MKRGRGFIRCAAVVVPLLGGLMLSGSVVASPQWKIDFQGDSDHDGTYGQTGPVSYAETGSFWNVFEVPALRAPWPTPFTADPSMPLLDDTGAPSRATFSILDNAYGWAGWSDGDPLMGDYLIIGNYFGVANSPLTWMIEGLASNTRYRLTFYHHTTDASSDRGIHFKAIGYDIRASRGVRVRDLDGYGWTLCTVLGIPGRNSASVEVTTYEEGTILGYASTLTYTEGNWAALTIEELADGTDQQVQGRASQDRPGPRGVAAITIESVAPASDVRDGPNDDAELYVRLEIGSTEYAIPREFHAVARSSGSPGWVFMSPSYSLPLDVWSRLALWEYDPGGEANDDQVDISPDAQREWHFLLPWDNETQTLTSSGTGSSRATVSITVDTSVSVLSNSARQEAMYDAWLQWRNLTSALRSPDDAAPSAFSLSPIIAETVDVVQMLPASLVSSAASYASQEMQVLAYADTLREQAREAIRECGSGQQVGERLTELASAFTRVLSCIGTADEAPGLLALAQKAEACRQAFEALLYAMPSSSSAPARAFLDSVFGVLSRLATNHAACLESASDGSYPGQQQSP